MFILESNNQGMKSLTLATMSRSINFVAILVLLITASGIEEIAAAPTCNEVVKEVNPCLVFVKGSNPADNPPPACCTGAADLDKKATTKPDQQAVCECLKGVLPKIGPYDPNRLPLIGQKCGLKATIPPITGNFDCSKL
ncbi:hypothetical protein PTKIN_Ptkin15bG0054100 [Pterospermum kingtungense]